MNSLLLLVAGLATGEMPLPDANGAVLMERCGTQSTISAVLREQFQEAPVAGGLLPGQPILVQFWQAPNGSSWTITSLDLRTDTMCVQLTGHPALIGD